MFWTFLTTPSVFDHKRDKTLRARQEPRQTWKPGGCVMDTTQSPETWIVCKSFTCTSTTIFELKCLGRRSLLWWICRRENGMEQWNCCARQAQVVSSSFKNQKLSLHGSVISLLVCDQNPWDDDSRVRFFQSWMKPGTYLLGEKQWAWPLFMLEAHRCFCCCWTAQHLAIGGKLQWNSYSVKV